jgi:hypothetical protein
MTITGKIIGVKKVIGKSARYPECWQHQSAFKMTGSSLNAVNLIPSLAHSFARIFGKEIGGGHNWFCIFSL